MTDSPPKPTFCISARLLKPRCVSRGKERSKGRRSSPSIAQPIQNERTDGHVRSRVSYTDIPPGFASGSQVCDPNGDNGGKGPPAGPRKLGLGPGRLTPFTKLHVNLLTDPQ